MHCLVTGCAGFIGSHLTEALLDAGASVVGVDCFNDNYARPQKLQNLERARSWENFDFVPVDLARGELRDLVEGVDALYHLAAEPGVRASWGGRFETYVRNNILATHHVMEAARHVDDIRVVYASSSSVYGQAETFPTPETALPRPFSPYGMTKLSAEHLCLLHHANHGVPVSSLRFFTVYGPRQRPDMAFTRFFGAALEGAPITVFGDGEQTRDFTYVADIVAALTAAAESDAAIGNVYNVGGGSQISLNETLRIIEDVTGRELDVQRLPNERGDVRHTGADTTLARRDLGYDPSTPIREGLERQFEWVAARAAA
ncbi:MAG TPA: NAD-dependent epimerase/dehydratase family protein [Solirubrobacteraceae bacterium]|nr:NAD-dependent epimerase/dehydratase family protein [Solirubrobacteraceae bacterium]